VTAVGGAHHWERLQLLLVVPDREVQPSLDAPQLQGCSTQAGDSATTAAAAAAGAVAAAAAAAAVVVTAVLLLSGCVHADETTCMLQHEVHPGGC
jgi:hypothetical protein